MHLLSLNERRKASLHAGFTIVELLIVVVVIAILAAITIVSYNGITSRAKETVLKSDLQSGAKQLQIAYSQNGSFPGDASGIQKSESTVFNYTSTDNTFCLTATSTSLANKSFYITDAGVIQEGSCPSASAAAIQTITNASCPTARTMVVDARDNRTYWVQKLADNKCWMLTNLAYAGGGTNTYNDVKTLSSGNGNPTSYSVAYYYVPTNANPTTNPTQPSTSTDGGATAPQYGYLYNWCAAMGGVTSTSACSGVEYPYADTSVSVCPAGWRLPTGNGGEFQALNTAVNSGSTTNDSGLRTTWLGQRSGGWWEGFSSQGSQGIYWSATQYSGSNAYNLYFTSSSVSTGGTAYITKTYGRAVRCVAV